MLKELIFYAEFFQEDDVYVGLCSELNVSSFGEDIDDAKHSLLKAVRAFLEACEEMGTLEEVLEESGFLSKNGVWLSREPINMTTAGMSRERYFQLLDMVR